MIEGSSMVKLRANSRQYHRYFRLLEDLSAIRWTPTSKKSSKAQRESRAEGPGFSPSTLLLLTFLCLLFCILLFSSVLSSSLLFSSFLFALILFSSFLFASPLFVSLL